MKIRVPLIPRLASFLRLLSTETIASPPHGRARLIASIFIVAYLLWQVVLPLGYYLGDAKFDERFSWRMFSAFGRYQKKCTVTIRQTVMSIYQEATPPAPPQDLEDTFGNFLKLLKRNRAAVVDKFLRTRCQMSPWVIRVQLTRMCPTAADGSEIPSGYLVLNCITGDLRGTLVHESS